MLDIFGRAWVGWAGSEEGQGTVEYVLVILAAAAIALALIGWMASDGLVSNLFSSVLSKVIGFVTGG